MVFPVETLFRYNGYDASDVKALTACCVEAGLEEAIDTAFLKEDEALEVTGGDSRLAGLLSEAGKKARPMMEKWSEFGVRAGRGGEEGAPGEVVELVQRPRSSGLPPPGGTGFPNNKVVRSSRLLRSCVRRFLKKTKQSRPAPPICSIEQIEGARLSKAKKRIHEVIVRFYPTCRRLSQIPEEVSCSAGADDAGRTCLQYREYMCTRKESGGGEW